MLISHAWCTEVDGKLTRPFKFRFTLSKHNQCLEWKWQKVLAKENGHFFLAFHCVGYLSTRLYEGTSLIIGGETELLGTDCMAGLRQREPWPNLQTMGASVSVLSCIA